MGKRISHLVLDEGERTRRLKNVGIWSLSSVSKKVLALLEYARGIRGWMHFSSTGQYGSLWSAKGI